MPSLKEVETTTFHPAVKLPVGILCHVHGGAITFLSVWLHEITPKRVFGARWATDGVSFTRGIIQTHTHKQTSKQTNNQTKERRKAGSNAGTKERRNEGTKEPRSEGTKERRNERASEQLLFRLDIGTHFLSQEALECMTKNEAEIVDKRRPEGLWAVGGSNACIKIGLHASQVVYRQDQPTCCLKVDLPKDELGELGYVQVCACFFKGRVAWVLLYSQTLKLCRLRKILIAHPSGATPRMASEPSFWFPHGPERG